jgi:HAD superfamily hydrolase (TIGR01509 family)
MIHRLFWKIVTYRKRFVLYGTCIAFGIPRLCRQPDAHVSSGGVIARSLRIHALLIKRVAGETRLPTPQHADHRRLHPLPELILFDLDNTICDYAGARMARTRYAFEPHFAVVEELEIAIDAAMQHATDGDEHFRIVLAEHGITDPALIESVKERYIEDRYRGLKLFDDALEVVRMISKVAKVGMITNGPTEIQRPKIQLLEIEAYFPVIVISEEAGVWKPDPGIFEIALHGYGVEARNAVYVGDSPEHDIPGAHAAGMRAVWINRTGVRWPGGREPDAEIRGLYELLPLVGAE